jgi:hypothetical protein
LCFIKRRGEFPAESVWIIVTNKTVAWFNPQRNN